MRGPFGPLVIAALAAFFVLSASTPAAADDPPTPQRATPVARASSRAAAQPPSVSLGYDALERHAFDVSADLTALDTTLTEVMAQRSVAQAQTIEIDGLSDRLTAIRDRLQREALKLTKPGAVAATLSQPEREAVDEMRGMRAGLQQRLVALTAEAVDLAAAGAGRVAVPAKIWTSPAQGEITQRFGPTRVRLEPARTYEGVYSAHFHDGVDIGATWDAPVVAAAPGRVVFAGRMLDGNWIVLIAHVGGYVSLYAHLDPRYPAVAAGDYVAANQRIGTVGSTGVSTGPHLHFSVWHDGALVDPMTVFRG